MVAPAHPGFEAEDEALNADPAPIEELSVPAIITSLEKLIDELGTQPIIVGRSAGGVFTQILLGQRPPRHADTYVDHHNESRAPLLFVAGEHDHLRPPRIQRSNAKHHTSNTVTELVEIPGRSHLMPPNTAGRRSPTTH
ncbi:alpha/beta fold hydrolase [Streptomyces sp. NPDC057287]|uniref:alpha/beta fold hydrolase n=1 Tax=Streptomyces sp. NPDC057287 TaxID=3346086 RepID=UPI00362D4505